MALRTRAHVRGASHHGHEIGLRPLAEVGNLFRGADTADTADTAVTADTVDTVDTGVSIRPISSHE